MPNAFVEPNVPLTTLIKDIPGGQRIPNFSSRLFFFDNLILPVERLPEPLRGAAASRHIFSEGKLRDPKLNRVLWERRSPGGVELAKACLGAKEEFENGKFRPVLDGDLDKLRAVEGTEVFISQRLIEYASLEKQLVISIDFLDGLPIPSNKWSLEGILEFKRKNYKAYRGFWNALDQITSDLRFLNHPDPETQLRTEVIQGIDEYTAKAKDTFGSRIRDAISFHYSISKTAPAISLAGFSEAQNWVDFPALASFTIGALGIVEVKLALKPALPPLSQRARGMSYLSKIIS